jgi:F0F1-type ATP synthase delta subunit
MNKDIQIEYSIDENLLCGIVLSSRSQQLGWNLRAYLDDLDSRLNNAFNPSPTNQ